MQNFLVVARQYLFGDLVDMGWYGPEYGHWLARRMKEMEEVMESNFDEE